MILQKHLQPDFSDGENPQLYAFMREYMALVPYYQGAMREISTKLENLDNEYSFLYEHNPIHHMQCRLKTPKSIYAKLVRKQLSQTAGDIYENIRDVAGIRVICNYTQDVYQIAHLLSGQSDVTMLQTKDYIQNPKPNGYRSLHLIISVPVFLSRDCVNIPVEIQLRTIAMDMWASLEHKLRYKSNNKISEKQAEQLLYCAQTLADIDRRMLEIHGEHNPADPSARAD